MDKKECLQILAIARAAFPNVKIEDPKAMCEAWLMCLGEYDANNIMQALKLHICKSKYFPTVAEIIQEHTRAIFVYGDAGTQKLNAGNAQPMLQLSEGADHEQDNIDLLNIDD